MKNQLNHYTNKLFLIIGGLLLSMMSYAQDGLDIDVDLNGDDSAGFFTSPLFWVGIAVFLIILAIIFKGGKK